MLCYRSLKSRRRQSAAWLVLFLRPAFDPFEVAGKEDQTTGQCLIRLRAAAMIFRLWRYPGSLPQELGCTTGTIAQRGFPVAGSSISHQLGGVYRLPNDLSVLPPG